MVIVYQKNCSGAVFIQSYISQYPLEESINFLTCQLFFIFSGISFYKNQKINSFINCFIQKQPSRGVLRKRCSDVYFQNKMFFLEQLFQGTPTNGCLFLFDYYASLKGKVQFPQISSSNWVFIITRTFFYRLFFQNIFEA